MTEEITILKIGTSEAVKSVNDLKENIKVLKQTLGDLDVGSKEYQEALKDLKVNQNALKDAMYATSSSMEDVSKAARGQSETYNSLVHRMAKLKEEFRATGDAARRMQLGEEIKGINDQLKQLDALQGNFQRNVGNYTESIQKAFKGLGDQVDGLRKGLKLADGGLNGFKDGMEGIAKSPALGTIGILVSLVVKLAGELKENETAMAAIKKLMDSLKPVTEFFSGIIERLADLLGDVIVKVTEFLGSNGLFQKIIQGVMGVGNAILQFVLAPIKGLAAAFKVFKEEGVKGIGNAAKAFGQEIKSGVAFKTNFQAGQAVADTIIAGAKSKKKEVKQAAQDLSKSFEEGLDLKGIEAEIQKQLDSDIALLDKAAQDANKTAQDIAKDRLSNLSKAVAHQLELNQILTEDEKERENKAYEIQKEGNERRLALLRDFAQEAIASGDMDAYLDYWEEIADLEVEIETDALREKKRLRDLDLKDAQENVKAQKATLQGLASATSSILGSIADLYEADSEQSEAQANRIKALRIASATIETISGAVGAYMQSVATIPPPAGAIVGAIQAAAVTAAGMAQIAQIRNTKVSANASAAETTPVIPAIQSAPATQQDIPQVRSITSASEEDRLNRMASNQRVYILSSDIEASQKARRTQVAETSF